jgi:hypothetical protein
MNMAINKRTIFPLVLLLFVAVATIQLTGCGPDAAPSGSKITVTPFGDPVVLNPVTIPTVTAPTTKMQSYRVSVADPAGLPMNDIDVNFLGQFTNGQSINFGGSAPVTAPVTVSITRKTDRFGFLLFDVTVPYYAVTPIHVPYNQTAVGSATGGTMADGTYFYTVTALDFAGETDASLPVSAVVTNITPTTQTGSVAVSWQAVPGATSYRVYRGTTALTLRSLVQILNPSGDPLTFTDVGNTTGATAPPTANTTGLSLNSIIGTVQATSGDALATFDISF